MAGTACILAGIEPLVLDQPLVGLLGQQDKTLALVGGVLLLIGVGQVLPFFGKISLPGACLSREGIVLS